MEKTTRGYWVLGTEAPRYCYSGQFIRGFQATSAQEALAMAQASRDGHKFVAVVEYAEDLSLRVVYPPTPEVGSDGVPF